MIRKSLPCLILAVLLAASACTAPDDMRLPVDPAPADSAEPDVSPSRAPAPEESAGVSVSQGDQTITPYESFLWSSDYTENGWLAACGMGMFYLLPELAQELPRLDRSAAFEIGVPDNGEIISFSVFDGAFGRTHHNISEEELPEAIAAARGNLCYVVFQVVYQGEYIPSEGKSENSGCEYAFALAWDDEPALAAWALEPEDIAYIERFDGSTDPDTSSYVWASDARVAEALAWIAGIEPLEFVSLESPARDTPGGSYSLLLHCFDGRTVAVGFALDTVLTDRGYYTYAKRVEQAAPPPFSLHTSEPSYSYKTDGIPITLVNKTDQTGSMSFVPALERMSEEGWTALNTVGGFCGTPDPFPPGVKDAGAVPLSLFEDVTPGVYRLSFYATDAGGTEYRICAVFRLEELS